MPSSEGNHQREADQQHRKGEQLASRERAQIQPNMGIGLPNEFDEEPEHAIEPDKAPGHRSRIEILSE
jgi:hypothetical protein